MTSGALRRLLRQRERRAHQETIDSFQNGAENSNIKSFDEADEWHDNPAAHTPGCDRNSNTKLGKVFHDSKTDLSSFVDPKSKSIHSLKAWFLGLCLEPIDVRSDRLLMISEAYAIFGALFFNGTWFIWEYGKASGGSGNDALDRAFDFLAAITFVANILITFFASLLWLMSISFSTDPSFCYGSRNVLSFLLILLEIIFLGVFLTMSVGLYSNLHKNMSGAVLALVLCGVFLVSGMSYISFLMAREQPLVYKHNPRWFKFVMGPFALLTRHGRKLIREGGVDQAKQLQAKAIRERIVPEPEIAQCDRSSVQTSQCILTLLQRAATNIGRDGFNVMPYTVRLEYAWYDKAELLRGKSVDVLARYMPRRLAEEVKRIFEVEEP